MKCFPCLLLAVSGLCLASAAHAQRVTAPTVDVSTQPVIYVVGDSTAANQSRVTTIQGWGTPFLTYFAPTKVTAVNAALGGRSSRTFITEGHWDDLLAKLQPGDIVLLQWGHNDPYPLNDANGRGTLFGLGEETQDIIRSTTKKPETLHTFGWYMRKYIADIRAKGAQPVVLTLTVRDRWIGDKIERDPSQAPPSKDERPKEPTRYSVWSAEIAKAAHVPLLDVHNMIADRYDQEGTTVVSTYFNSAKDPTHRNPAGAAVDASIVLACLRSLEGPAFDAYLSAKGKAVALADPKYIFPNAPLTADALQPFSHQGNLDLEQDSATTPRRGEVVLGLAGDSTVNYSTGYGAGLRSHFDQRLQVVDLARGGRTAGSFRAEGRWAKMLALKPDYVMIQFGHNDEGRGWTPANLATYKANLVRFVDEARAAGIKPILVTPISRRYYGDDGKIHSDLIPAADAMKEVAAAKQVPLMDLHARAIELYEKLGKAVTDTWAYSKPNTAAGQPGQPATVLDKTHFTRVGSYALGPMVAGELKRAVPDLAPYIH